MKKKKYAERIPCLDGLRGLFAMAVYIGHFLGIFFPHSVFPPYGNSIIKTIQNSPIAILSMGVAYFFVLSGFVLPIKLFGAKSPCIFVSAIIKRYVSLILMIFLSSCLFYWLLKNHLFSYDEIGVITRGGVFEMAEPDAIWKSVSFKKILKFSLWENPFKGNSTYNSPLWTMKYELYGAWAIIVLVLLFGRNKYRMAIYAGLCLFLAVMKQPYYFMYVIGMVFSDITYNTHMDRFHVQEVLGKISNTLIFIFSLIILYFSVLYNKNDYFTNLFQYIPVSDMFFRGIGFIGLIISIPKLPYIKKIFETYIWQFLGRISFTIYVFHWSILLSLSTTLVLKLYLNLNISYHLSIGISFIITTIAVIVISWITEIFINKKYQQFIHKLLEY